MRIAIRRVHPDAKLPHYSRPGDAALDCYAQSDAYLYPGEVTPVPLGFTLAIPEGYVGLIRDRSGLARKEGVCTLAGVIDPNYRGEVTALFTSLKSPMVLDAGTRVCQLLIVPAPQVIWEEVAELPSSVRGAAGFGSSGS